MLLHFVLGMLIGTGGVAWAQASPACASRGVEALRQDSALGYRVLTAAPERRTFAAFLQCDRSDFHESLPSAVHETTHAIRTARNAYFTASGELVSVPSDDGYFAPKKMVGQMVKDLGVNTKDDTYYQTYLSPRGPESTSKDEFSFLLDELNAYTVDLKVSTDLANKGRIRVNPRSHGQPALMAYVAYYLQHAKKSEPATWQRLSRDGAMISAIRRLWAQGETVLSDACASPRRIDIMNDAKNYVAYLCGEPASAIAQVLGREVRCPTTCQGQGRPAIVHAAPEMIELAPDEDEMIELAPAAAAR